jgi:hypothetical protein
MRKIPITNRPDLFLLVDDKDFARIRKHRWSAMPSGRTVYAKSTSFGFTVTAHQLVLRTWSPFNLFPGLVSAPHMDHINGDGLDYRRSNLRVCTVAQHQANSVGQPDRRKSKYKGVAPGNGRMVGKWRASITQAGTQRHLGYFLEEEAAAQAYNAAAQKIFGEWAKLNEITTL